MTDTLKHMKGVVEDAGLGNAGLDEEDLLKLWDGKYRTAAALRRATGESLRAASLAPAAVDAILEGTKRASKHVVADLKEVVLSSMEDLKQYLESKLRDVTICSLRSLKLIIQTIAMPASSAAASKGADQGFRVKLQKFYDNMPDEKLKMRCMVTGKLLTQDYIVAGHLFAKRWWSIASVTVGPGFPLNDERNGILWNSAIELVYEEQRICFSYNENGTFTLHVLDKALLHKPLASVGQHKNNPQFAAEMEGLTFQQLNGQSCAFLGKGNVGPFKRALAAHAMFALSLWEGNYPEDFDQTEYNFDYMSDHINKAQFIEAWLETQANAGLPPEQAAEAVPASEGSVGASEGTVEAAGGGDDEEDGDEV